MSEVATVSLGPGLPRGAGQLPLALRLPDRAQLRGLRHGADAGRAAGTAAAPTRAARPRCTPRSSCSASRWSSSRSAPPPPRWAPCCAARSRCCSRSAGVVIAVFGLYLLGVLQHPRADARAAGAAGEQAGRASWARWWWAMAFGAGWTPCVGPVLASVLLYASFEETLLRGMVLLGAYALGLGIPFFLSAVALNWFLAGSAKRAALAAPAGARRRRGAAAGRRAPLHRPVRRHQRLPRAVLPRDRGGAVEAPGSVHDTNRYEIIDERIPLPHLPSLRGAPAGCARPRPRRLLRRRGSDPRPRSGWRWPRPRRRARAGAGRARRRPARAGGRRHHRPAQDRLLPRRARTPR